MSIEQEALMVLRKIAEGSDFAALFPAAGEDARKVESELRRLQSEVKRLEQESAGNAPCGHPARLTIEWNGKKLCTLCGWKKSSVAHSETLSRITLLEAKLKNEIFQRDAAEKDALRLRRKVKKLKLKGEPEKKRTPEEERLMQYIKTGDKTWMASAPGTSPGSHLSAGEPPEHFNHRCKVVEEPERTPEEKQTEPLKPCPFCESESAEVRPSKISSGFYVVCTNCGSDTRTFRTRSEAIAMWNKRSRRVAPPTPEQSGEYLESQGYTPKIAPRPGDALNPPSSGSNVYRPEAKPETALDINTMVIQATRDRAEIEYLRAALEKIACLGNYGDKPPYTHMIAAWGEWQPVWDFARGALDKKQAEPKAVRTTIKVDGVKGHDVLEWEETEE